MIYSTILATAALFTSALAAPTSTDMQLSKRATEGIHLVNCVSPRSEGSDQNSAVIYCPDDSACSFIQSSNFCSMSNNGFFGWEGGPHRCTFSSGVMFQWNIPGDAQSKPNYAVVDSLASNGFRGFTGRKDDQTKHFSFGEDFCTGIYYYL